MREPPVTHKAAPVHPAPFICAATDRQASCCYFLQIYRFNAYIMTNIWLKTLKAVNLYTNQDRNSPVCKAPAAFSPAAYIVRCKASRLPVSINIFHKTHTHAQPPGPQPLAHPPVLPCQTARSATPNRPFGMAKEAVRQGKTAAATAAGQVCKETVTPLRPARHGLRALFSCAFALPFAAFSLPLPA